MAFGYLQVIAAGFRFQLFFIVGISIREGRNFRQDEIHPAGREIITPRPAIKKSVYPRKP
jgi:hypothetical protein